MRFLNLASYFLQKKEHLSNFVLPILSVTYIYLYSAEMDIKSLSLVLFRDPLVGLWSRRLILGIPLCIDLCALRNFSADLLIYVTVSASEINTV